MSVFDPVDDWDFETLRNWAVVRAVDAFVFEGSKGLKIEMHNIITTAFYWNDAQNKKEANKKRKK